MNKNNDFKIKPEFKIKKIIVKDSKNNVIEEKESK